MEQDIQIIYKTLEEEKFIHGKTRDELNNLSVVNQKYEVETNELIGFNQQLESKLALTEQEKSESIMRLRDNI